MISDSLTEIAAALETALEDAPVTAHDSSSADSVVSAEASENAPPVEMRRMLVFTIAGRARCAPVNHVREIVPITSTTRLPGAPSYVRGLINLRGVLVTVLDAAKCLYGVDADDNTASILLVEHRGRVAGVIVDNVFDIQSLPASDLNDGSMLDLHEMVGSALA
jgi:chemotaxis signal transduction protein